MDYGSVAHRIEQFEFEHGEAAYDGTWFYYADGANRDGNPLGPLNGPDLDPVQRHRFIVRFYEIRLRQAVREFDDFKERLTYSPGLYPDEEQNLRELRKLQRRAKHWTRRLATAQDELKKHLPGYRSPEEEAKFQSMIAASDARRQRYEDMLNGINI